MRAVDRQRAVARVLHTQQHSKAEIAKRLGVSLMTVVALLRRPLTFPPRACQLCGAQFTPKSGRQRYCSETHRVWHRAGLPAVRECPHCGVSFAPRHGHQRFCTPEHQQQHQRRRAQHTAVAWSERVRALEREVARARAQLDAREAGQ